MVINFVFTDHVLMICNVLIASFFDLRQIQQEHLVLNPFMKYTSFWSNVHLRFEGEARLNNMAALSTVVRFPCG